jgi:hypothetical protein
MRLHSAVLLALLLAAAVAAPVAVQVAAQTTETAPAPAAAQTPLRAPAADSFVAGGSDLPDLAAPGDVFATGARLRLRGAAEGDIHAMGFDVELGLPARGDVYLMGGSVRLRAPVDGDLSAMGFSVETATEARVAGNARLSGGAVLVSGPIGGSLTASGAEVRLDSAVAGDAYLAGADLSFGPSARVDGTLTIAGPEAVDVPPSVAPPERVVFEPRAEVGPMGGMGARMGHVWDEAPHGMASAVGMGFLTMFWGALWGYVALLGVGALAIGVAPAAMDRLREQALAEPGWSILWGAGGLAGLFGLVPLLAITIIGLPLALLALALLPLAWMAGLIVGAFAIAARVATAFGMAEPRGFSGRIGLLAGGLAGSGLLGFIPFLGWIANLAIVLLGFGALIRGARRGGQ